ncbi:hypothetical protein GPAL_1260 [Glaciecola pallidula DSM 14239 = ACAM 615]|uniref:Uncharacterized protein n=1 Tax=Brumicola pallidula DSM 14239 = ACAM 615 TaxID=1121922 RepID=K6ZGT9_9ALTE|nr:hypothetical protein GPAL_1260 [Glaciecola pallidula DSM 14239 = ACAM 615]
MKRAQAYKFELMLFQATVASGLYRSKPSAKLHKHWRLQPPPSASMSG